MRMYLKYEVPFFKMYDMSTIAGICKTLELWKFAQGETLFKVGSKADYLYILIEGKLEIYVDNEMTQSAAQLTPAAIVGERAFLNNLQTRSKACKAIEASKCLVLDRESFFAKIQFFEHLRKQNRLSFIKQIPFCQKWPVEKLNHFNSALGEVFLEPDDVLYDIG